MSNKLELFDVRAAQAKGRAEQARKRAMQQARRSKSDTSEQTEMEAEADRLIREAKAHQEAASAPDTAIGPDDLTTAAMAKIMYRIKCAREDPAAFIEFAMRTPEGKPLELAWFHREWLQAMVDESMLVIEAPRGHGKTTIMIGFVLWLLGTNPNLRIKLMSQNDDKAKERLFELRQNMETNQALKLVFPHLKPDETGEWTKQKLYVQRTAKTRDPSFQASGVLTSVTGGRIDVLICDDVCDMRNSLLYPSLREDIKQKFQGEILGTLTPGSRVLYIATPYHMADLTALLKSNPAWTTKRYKIGVPENPFQPLWPAVWTEELLKKQRNLMGSVEFDRAYRCEALSGNTVPCKPEWLRFYTAELLGDPMQHVCIQGYDLAISKKTSADYFAGVTILYDPTRHFIFVVEARQGKYSFAEQGLEVIMNYKRWHTDKIMIETVGLGGGLESFLKEKGPPEMPLLGYYPRGDKQRRFLEITPLFEDGRIFFHPKLNPNTNSIVGDTGDLITQLLEFPVSKHDDLVDALVTAISGLGDYFMSDPDPEWEQGDGTQVRMSVVG